MPGGLIVKLSKELAHPATAAACARLIAKCSLCSTPAEVITLLSGAALAVGPYIGVLAMSEVHASIRSKQGAADLQANFRSLHGAIQSIEEARSCERELVGLVGELLGDRVRWAEAIAPDQMLAEIKAAVTASGGAATANMDEWFDHTRIYLSKIAADTEAALEIGRQTLTVSERTDAKVDQITEFFMTRITQLESENNSLREQVRAAVERVAQAEQAAGRDPIIRLESLRQGDPKDLLAFLDDELNHDEREFIEKHRERAAVAYVLGEIAKAKQSLDKILALLPTDLDAINSLGHIYKLLGDLSAAVSQYKHLLEIDPSDSTAAIANGNLGLIERTRGNLDAAEDYHKRSLAISESLGLKMSKANQLGSLGWIERTRGNVPLARDYWSRALRLFTEIGMPHMVEHVQSWLDALPPDP